MARQKKTRRVCGEPLFASFEPHNPGKDEPLVMTVDEYETIRLMDYEGLSQEECAKRMNVARTTITQIYDNARKTMARCLVEGRRLTITGGSYELCNGSAQGICNGHCCTPQ